MIGQKKENIMDGLLFKIEREITLCCDVSLNFNKELSEKLAMEYFHDVNDLARYNVVKDKGLKSLTDDEQKEWTPAENI